MDCVITGYTTVQFETELEDVMDVECIDVCKSL